MFQSFVIMHIDRFLGCRDLFIEWTLHSDHNLGSGLTDDLTSWSLVCCLQMAHHLLISKNYAIVQIIEDFNITSNK